MHSHVTMQEESHWKWQNDMCKKVLHFLVVWMKENTAYWQPPRSDRTQNCLHLPQFNEEFHVVAQNCHDTISVSPSCRIIDVLDNAPYLSEYFLPSDTSRKVNCASCQRTFISRGKIISITPKYYQTVQHTSNCILYQELFNSFYAAYV